MLLVIVYVGAVAVLFLFVVMMLDIDFAELRAGFAQYLPFGVAVAVGAVGRDRVRRRRVWDAGARPAGRRTAPTPAPDAVPNIEAIGTLLYTRYLFVFEGAGLVLLVAMIGAIVLTHRARGGVRRQNITQQNMRRPQDATRNDQSASRPGSRAVIGLEHYLVVSAILFVMGVLGIFINRKNVIIILMAIELILLAVNLNLVAFSAYPARSGRPDLRDVRADRRGGRGGDRACHPRHLFPWPRHHRGR